MPTNSATAVFSATAAPVPTVETSTGGGGEQTQPTARALPTTSSAQQQSTPAVQLTSQAQPTSTPSPRFIPTEVVPLATEIPTPIEEITIENDGPGVVDLLGQEVTFQLQNDGRYIATLRRSQVDPQYSSAFQQGEEFGFRIWPADPTRAVIEGKLRAKKGSYRIGGPESDFTFGKITLIGNLIMPNGNPVPEDSLVWFDYVEEPVTTDITGLVQIQGTTLRMTGQKGVAGMSVKLPNGTQSDMVLEDLTAGVNQRDIQLVLPSDEAPGSPLDLFQQRMLSLPGMDSALLQTLVSLSRESGRYDPQVGENLDYMVRLFQAVAGRTPLPGEVVAALGSYYWNVDPSTNAERAQEDLSTAVLRVVSLFQ